MLRNRNEILALTVTSVAAAFLSHASAFGFACYVGQDVPLYKFPNEKAKIVAQLKSTYMVGEVSDVPQRDGWILVRWSIEQTNQAEFGRGKGQGKGWLKYDQVIGECED